MNTPSLPEQAPFLSQPERTEAEVTVTGRLPEWLAGDVVRTCPAVFQRQNWQADHWFDGLGLLYGFRFGGGRVSFRQNLLQTQFTQSISQGDTDIGGFGTPPRRSFMQRVLHPTPKALDNTNVHCLMLGDDLVALTETNRQSLIDPETLAFRGYVTWRDGFNDLMTLAHPQYDTRKKMVVTIGSAFGASPALVALEHSPQGRERREIGRWRMKELPYTHSFGLTDAHVVLIAHPFTVSPISMLWSNRAFIEHFTWRSQNGTTLGRMDRATGQVHRHTCESFFVFHTVNAFERSSETVLDVLAYDDAGIIDALKMPALRQGLTALTPRLLRLRMKHGVEAAVVEPLSDAHFEFPIIPYMAQSGLEHTAVWGANIKGPRDQLQSEVLRINGTGSPVARYSEAGWVFGEPLFASKPGASAVDEGVLLTVGSHQSGTRSKLQVLDSRTLEPVAQAQVELPIPLGFHGSFIRAKATAN